MAGEKEWNSMRGLLNLGEWDEGALGKIIEKAMQFRQTGRKIEFISRQFLGTGYREGTLVGTDETPEVLVIDFSGMDCFTYIDYVEALRLSHSLSEVAGNLMQVRYRSAIVSFSHRNHFFSDWSVYCGERVEDVTRQVGGARACSSEKILNRREDGTPYLPGIPQVVRTIHYIPAAFVNQFVLSQCRTGDYLGIYAEDRGLDVTHVGIFIRRRGEILLRHASSLYRYRAVMDQDLRTYMADKPGFVVLRPKNQKG